MTRFSAFFEKIDNQCLIIGGGSSIISLVNIAISIMCLVPRHYHYNMLALGSSTLEVHEESILIAAWVTLVISAIWALSSILFIIAIKKAISGFILFYLMYAVFVIIVFSIEAMLLLLHRNYIPGFGMIVLCITYGSQLNIVYRFHCSVDSSNATNDQQNLLENDDL